MPMPSLRSARVGAVSALVLSLSLAVVAPVSAGSLPRALPFRGEMIVEIPGDGEDEESHRGVLQIRGEFRADRCRITLKGRELPAPESGEYALVLIAEGGEVLAAQFAPDERGRVAFEGNFEMPEGDESGDPRRFGMNLALAVLFDGDYGLAEAPLGCAVKVSVRGRMESNEVPARAALSLSGDASRGSNGQSEYRFQLTLRGLAAGTYVLLLSGEAGDFALEFEVPDSRRSSRSLKFRGEDDLVNHLLAFEEMALYRVVGEEEEEWLEVMVGSIDCR